MSTRSRSTFLRLRFWLAARNMLSLAFGLVGCLLLSAGCSKSKPKDGEAVAVRQSALEAPAGWPSEHLVAEKTLKTGSKVMISGDVAVSSKSDPKVKALNLGGSSVIGGSVRADIIQLGTGAIVKGDATYNSLTGTGLVLGTKSSKLVLPLTISKPIVPTFAVGTTPVNVAATADVTLPPGDYEAANLVAGLAKDNTVLLLTGGTYNFASVTIGANARFECAADCEIRVLGRFTTGSATFIGPAAGSRLGAENVRIFVTSVTDPLTLLPVLSVGNMSTWVAFGDAPSGLAQLGSGSLARGKILAKDISLGGNAEFCAPSETRCGGSASTFNTGGDFPEQAIVALNSIELKGNASVTGDVSVLDAHRTLTLAKGEELVLGTGAKITGAVRANIIDLSASSTIVGAAGFNSLRGTGTVQGTRSTPLALPIPIPGPNFPEFSAGIDDIELLARADRSLDAGVYRTVQLRQGRTDDLTVLTLTGGVYTFATLEVASYSRVECAATCELRIEGRFAPASKSYLGPKAGTAVTAADIRLFVKGSNGAPDDPKATPFAVTLGADHEFRGKLFAPNGTASLGTRAIVRATVMAKDVSVGTDVVACLGVDTTCNGLDDNCNGSVDEDYKVAPSSCGVGACVAVGQKVCQNGQETDTCKAGTPAPSDATCDGIDDNCNGQVDENFKQVATSCGVGACGSSGEKSCQNGHEVDSCKAGTAAANDATCDGIDDNCNGQVDEDYTVSAISCGQGVCAATGTKSCVGGQEKESCTVGTPTASRDTSCNGLDDDCDGSVDEDYAPKETSCGVGVCAAVGTTSCVAGAEVSSCVAKAPSGADDNCNGLDDNCNGQVDEDYAVSAISCGQGVCLAHGERRCEAGAERDICRPGTPAASSDTSCNGLDDDCDGGVDEDFVPAPSSCGVGVCGATGVTSCVAGSVATHCTPKLPAGADDDCDGLDDDCNGTPDDHFVSVSTQCGVGLCRSAGVTSCVAGGIVDSCRALSSAGEDSTCNGLDDDCDGSIDEDFVPNCAADARVSCVGGKIVSTSCSDGNACNGAESCVGGACQGGQPLALDDGNPCTLDSCDSTQGVTHQPANEGTSCGAGQLCNAAGNCGAQGNPPVIVTEPADAVVDVGGQARFEISASGTSLTYQWRRFNAPLVGATSPVLLVPNASLSDSGASYQVVVSNARGSVTSRAAALTVNDSVPPVIHVDGELARNTTTGLFRLTGTVNDVGSGVESVRITSDRFIDSEFAATVSADSSFLAEIPVALGQNRLLVQARDKAGQKTEVRVDVTFAIGLAPDVTFTSPLDGAIVKTPTIDVSGRVLSQFPPEEIRLVLNNDVRFPVGANNDYSFTFPKVGLSPGLNTLKLAIQTRLGVDTKELHVVYQDPNVPPPVRTPPAISVEGARELLWVTSDPVSVQGTVSSTDTCIQSVTVNQVPAALTLAGFTASFKTAAPLLPNVEITPIKVHAVDCLGASSDLEYRVQRDLTAPVIDVELLTDAPNVTLASETPYFVRGVVREANLTGLSGNNQSLSVLPGALPGTFDFSFPVSLARGLEQSLTIEAWDQAGNRASRTFIIKLQSTLALEILEPAEGSRFLAPQRDFSLGVSVRTPGVLPTDKLFVQVDSLPRTFMSVSGEFAQGTAALSGYQDHVLRVEAESADGTLLARATRRVTLVDPGTIKLELSSQEPANGARNVEVNHFILWRFNKPIDPSLVKVKVIETANSVAFSRPPAGADLGELSRAPTTISTVRNQSPVVGNLGFFEGNTLLAFYPTADYAYDAGVNIEISEGDVEVARTEFRTRPTPALFQGFVSDQFRNPLSDFDVLIEETGQRVTTDAFGAFGFGFGAFADSLAPGSYTLVLNPDGKEPRFGSQKHHFRARGGTLSQLGILGVPSIDDGEPFRRITSRSSQIALLSGDAVELDLSEAELIFPNGRPEGDVHGQLLKLPEIGHPREGGAVTPYAYHFNPPGVQVSGKVAFSLALPRENSNLDYVAKLPEYFLISGLDPRSLTIVPIGVARVDRARKRISSVGVVKLELLDYLAFGLVRPDLQAELARFASGEIELSTLISRLK